MRSSMLRWSLLGTALFCLSVVSFAGCKSPGFSMPSPNWLSWGKKQPSPTALSKSSLPTKPSAGALPNPSMTTASTAQPAGPAGSFGSAGASYPSPAYGKSAYGAQTAAAGYYTGPYGTSTPSAGAGGALPQGGYPVTPYSNGWATANQANQSLGAATSYGAGQYQSPYQAPYQAAGDAANADGAYGYRTADSRNNVYGSTSGPTAGSNPLNPPTRQSAPSGTWSSDGWRRDADPYSGAQAAPTGYGRSSAANQSLPQNPYASSPASHQYGGYGAASPGGRGLSEAGAESPYRSGSEAFGAGSNNVSEPSSSFGTGPRDGAYRPGSTARNTTTFTSGTWQSGQVAPPWNAATESSGFDQESGAAYPSTGTPSQPASYGGYSYPSTGQYR